MAYYAEYNLCRMTERNELNLILRPFLAPINSQAVTFLMLRLDYDDNKKTRKELLGFSRSISFFCTAPKIKLASISRPSIGSSDTTSRKSTLEEKML